MNQVDLLTRLAVALAIGLLAGLERGWQKREEEPGQRVAGLRTFAISGLLGGVAAAVAQKTDSVVLGLVFLGYAVAMTAFYWLEAAATRTFSITSLIAGLLTMTLGAYAVLGELPVAIAAAVAMVLLLALREPLHRWLASLSWEEIRAVLILLAMTFLLLPVLPNRPVDPWGALNPHDIWLFAILIAAVSFAGYIAVRLFGDQLGVIAAAFAGGLASSTATTLTLARLGRDRPRSAMLIAGGILIAGLVMVARAGIVAGALNPALVPRLALPLASGVVVLAGAAGLFLIRRPKDEQLDLEIDNPLQLGTAIKFAALIAVLTLATKIVGNAARGAGALAIAAVSGVADVDAVTISMARSNSIPIETATLAILTVVAVNTLAKAVIAGWVGGARVGFYVGGASLVAVLAGGAAALLAR
ncbi:MAG TPA: MgtC/SapB family protein [Devosiaceae bacterium]|nr:MgtC/SapB family protein [Devosiaceae bacterium]